MSIHCGKNESLLPRSLIDITAEWACGTSAVAVKRDRKICDVFPRLTQRREWSYRCRVHRVLSRLYFNVWRKNLNGMERSSSPVARQSHRGCDQRHVEGPRALDHSFNG